MTIDLPDIRFEGKWFDGSVYVRLDDVQEWLLACMAVAQAVDVHLEAGQYVEGMADSVERARRKSRA